MQQISETMQDNESVFQGVPLTHFIGDTRMDITDHLRLARNIVDALLELHNQNTIHSDLQPQHILIQEKNYHCQIQGLEKASKWGFEQRDFDDADKLSGDLSYMSPEHTGRTNKRLDFRSDIYSLGMILYELFTGEKAFDTTDALTLLHAHLVRQPKAPHERKRQVPNVISEIVLKCIDKNPDARYQGARGVLEDIITALKKRNPIGHIPNFVIGKHDVPAQFTIPQTLYGRDDSMVKIQDIFQAICNGDSHLLLLAGKSGIGKTALIKELYNPITEKGALLLRGKFEELNNNVPYRAFSQAFNEWATIITNQNEDEQLRWKAIIQNAVGSNAKLLTDLAPEIEKVLGEQAPLPELGPTESQNRFNTTIAQFLSAITADGERIVLFLDDLQWADSGALSLLKHLALNTRIPRLMAIGAFRDNEFDAARWLGDEASHPHLTQIQLGPISQSTILELVNDIFGKHNPNNAQLANILHDKTLGNPFFVNQILQHMHREQCFTLNTRSGHWEWDAQTVATLTITENVADFLLSQITSLPENTQILLKSMAIMGTKGTLANLLAISQLAPDKCLTAISLLINKGYLATTTSYAQLMNAIGDTNSPESISLAFAHDRIQEASYSTMTLTEREKLHLTQVRLLLQNPDVRNTDQDLYNLLYHCDQCHTLLSELERKRVCTLYLLAGKRAKTTMAYASATRFLNAGLALLKISPDNASLQFELEFEKAESQFLAGHHDDANQLFDTLLHHASTEEKVEIYDKRAILEPSLGNADKSVAFGLKGLRLLQLKLNPHPSQFSILMRILKIKWLMRHQKIADLTKLPKMTNPQVLAQMRLVLNIAGPTYQVSPDLFTLLMLDMTIKTLKYGLIDLSSFAFSGYAIVLGPGMGEYKNSYEFGILAQKICEQYYSEALMGKSLFVFAAFISPWNKPIRDVYELLWKSTKINRQNGDFAYANWALFCNLHLHFLNGEPLSTVQTLIRDNSEAAKNEISTHHNLLITQYAIDSLTEDTGSLSKLGKEDFDEAAFAKKVASLVTKPPQCWYYIVKQMLCYMAGDYDASLHYAKKTNKMIAAVLGFYWFQTHYFFTFLALAAKIDSAGPIARIALKIKMRTPYKKFKKWAHHCPENFTHKLLLIKAEIARINGNPSKALAHYDMAISHANSQKFIHHTAIIAERAALTCLATNNTRSATHYIETAVFHYQEWGATKKANQLFTLYPHLLANFLAKQDEVKHADKREDHKNSLETTNPTQTNFDSMAIIKASQVISSQIILEDLLSNLIHVLLEAAGAENAAIILNRNDELTVVASRNAITEETKLTPILLKDTDELLKPLVKTCWNTQSISIVENAIEDDNVRHNTYVKHNKIKSVACMPIIRQGTAVGLVYLENNQIEGVFTESRMAPLGILSAQAAIALENAILVNEITESNKNLEAKVEEQVKELEDARAYAEKVQQQTSYANLTKGIAHEIRNPLGMMMTNTQALMRQIKRGDEQEKQLKHLDMLLNATRRLKDTLDSMLKFDKGQHEFEMTPVRVNAIIEEIISLSRKEIEAQNVTLTLDLDNTLPPIPGHAISIRQIVTNLYLNALQALGTNTAEKTLMVSTTSGTFKRDKMDIPAIKITIKDNGPGIPEKEINHLFDAFHTTKYENMGIGLSIVLQLINSHKGKIDVESQVGKGAEFKLYFPIEQTEHSAANAPH